jgi:hypothetical protein
MAREVQIMTWCDHCLNEENLQVEGMTYVGLNSAGARVEIDLCAECAESFLTPALSALDAYGRDEPKPKRRKRVESPAPAGGQCPDCDKTFPTKQALGMHRWRAHNVPGEGKGKKSA